VDNSFIKTVVMEIGDNFISVGLLEKCPTVQSFVCSFHIEPNGVNARSLTYM